VYKSFIIKKYVWIVGFAKLFDERSWAVELCTEIIHFWSDFYLKTNWIINYNTLYKKKPLI